MTLRCVPVEPTEEMISAWLHNPAQAKNTYAAMLAAAPPLPPDLEEALKVAKFYANLPLTLGGERVQLARALLKSHGREE